jgi:NMD protein affecting ribosome stability and mRNA decay
MDLFGNDKPERNHDLMGMSKGKCKRCGKSDIELLSNGLCRRCDFVKYGGKDAKD